MWEQPLCSLGCIGVVLLNNGGSSSVERSLVSLSRPLSNERLLSGRDSVTKAMAEELCRRGEGEL
jgi:hypothetical protein